LAELESVFFSMAGKIERLIASNGSMKSGNTGVGNAQTITVTANVGGFGVWIATTACLVMLGAGFVGALWVSSEFRRYDAEIAALKGRDNAQQAYLNNIFQQAPHLKPKDK
jgi:hypothetical protein